MDQKKIIRNIRWLGHSGFFIKEKPAIYIDPYNLAFPDIGDLILITNKNEHHCSPEDVKWLRKGATVIIAPETCVNLFYGGDIRAAKPGEKHEIKGAQIQVISTGEDDKLHQSNKDAGVGYLITYSSGLCIYHMGHSKILPESESLEADVFLIPIGKQSGMSIAQSAEMINKVHPKVSIPMHWDEKSITSEEKTELVELCKSVVIFLKPKR